MWSFTDDDDDDDESDSASAASVMTAEGERDETYVNSGSEKDDDDESESEEEEDEEEKPLKPAKILARKTLKPAEWREMCKDMSTDQVIKVLATQPGGHASVGAGARAGGGYSCFCMPCT